MPDAATSRHFIEQIVDADIAEGTWGPPGDASVVRTRFPPEPNGSLHIGHAKSICLNFALAERFGGSCNLRFDDTNPIKEEDEFVRSIIRDVRWLGFRWTGAEDEGQRAGRPPHQAGRPIHQAGRPIHQPGHPESAGVLFASDYFQQMYDWAEELVRKGLAYVDDQSAEQIRATRGTLTEPGTPSPCRDRSPEENLDLLRRMRAGEFPDASRVLRARIDMASPNLNLRDPVMYRVLHARHHRTGDDWCIYPMYDWAHGLEDSIEGITHSICTLEFENHRPLYDWFIDAINRDRTDDGSGPWGRAIHHPRQIEFARLNLNYTVMSKRLLKQLVDDRHVSGWDDPRMPTISAMRRRGYTPESIRAFCDEIGVTKVDSVIDVARLESAVRQDLNRRAPRRMCVLHPLKVVITNWGEGGDEGRTEWLDAVNNPENPDAGSRQIPFSRVLWIERDDFMEDAPRKFFRLRPGGEVRLRYAYWITCRDVVKDDAGRIVELRCTYDPATRGGDAPPPDAQGTVRKVKGTIHWVSAQHAVPVEVRLFDRLFSAEAPGKWTGSFLDDLNPDSLNMLSGCMLEPNWQTSEQERAAGTGTWPDGIERLQFERLGYFCLDARATDLSAGQVGAGTPTSPVFNRTVSLRDSWAKVQRAKP